MSLVNQCQGLSIGLVQCKGQDPGQVMGNGLGFGQGLGIVLGLSISLSRGLGLGLGLVNRCLSLGHDLQQ